MSKRSRSDPQSASKNGKPASRRARRSSPSATASFTTLSDMEVPLLEHARGSRGRGLRLPSRSRLSGRVSLTPAAFSATCTAESSGPCASSRASRAPTETNKRFKLLLEHGQTGLSTAFDMPTLMGYDADSPRGKGRSRKMRRLRLLARGHGGALRRHPARRSHDLDDDQRSGDRDPGHVPRGRRKAGRAERQSARHSSERHSQRIHRAERVALSRSRPRSSSSSTRSSTAPSIIRTGTPSASAAITSAKRGRRPCRSSPSRSPTASAYVDESLKRGMKIDEFAPRLSFLLRRA